MTIIAMDRGFHLLFTFQNFTSGVRVLSSWARLHNSLGSCHTPYQWRSTGLVSIVRNQLLSYSYPLLSRAFLLPWVLYNIELCCTSRLQVWRDPASTTPQTPPVDVISLWPRMIPAASFRTYENPLPILRNGSFTQYVLPLCCVYSLAKKDTEEATSCATAFSATRANTIYMTNPPQKKHELRLLQVPKLQELSKATMVAPPTPVCLVEKHEIAPG